MTKDLGQEDLYLTGRFRFRTMHYNLNISACLRDKIKKYYEKQTITS